MPIELRCSQCQRLLRVPDASAGAKARCPQCGAIVDVPTSGAAGTGEPGGSNDFSPSQGANPFQQGAQPFQSAAKAGSGESVNPYSSPASTFEQPAKPTSSGEVVPTAVDVGAVISYAWDVWKSNLGILVGVTLVVFVANFGFGAVQGAVNAVFEQQDSPEIGAAIGFVISMVGNLIQIFLGIGQAHIVLKLLRGQPAEFGDLFGGGPLFLSVFGASILAGLAVIAGMVACIVPAILLVLFFWPFYWLIVDRKAHAIESFGMALPIGKLNAGTSFVLWLASVGIMMVGFLALCVGVLFAAPLVSTMWGAAYLMMSGQINQSRQV